jgi:hypothetical protein
MVTHRRVTGQHGLDDNLCQRLIRLQGKPEYQKEPTVLDEYLSTTYQN